MRTRFIAWSIVLFLLAVPLAGASVVAEMTPDAVRAAIATGVAAKTSPRYELRKPGFVGSVYKPVLGAFSTPFMRVAQSAHAAKLTYKEFTAADVQAELIAPELHVYGFAQADGAAIANVTTIVVTPKGTSDASAAIRPLRIEPIPVTFRNLFGLNAGGDSMFAVFPLKVLQPGNVIHIIFDAPVHDGAANKYCQDCSVALDLSKVQ